METVVIRVYYDFASTLCYIAHRVMGGIVPQVRDLGVVLQWRPIDLTEIVPWNRGDSFAQEIREAVHNTGSSMGVEVQMPDAWVDSRPASKIALLTESDEDEARWRDQVFRCFFELREKELTPELLSLGRDLSAHDNGRGAQDEPGQVAASTKEAIALGVQGVPTFLLDVWPVGGIQDADTMLDVLARFAERYREHGHTTVN